MNFTIEIIKRFAPLFVILFALMPFLYVRLFCKNSPKPKLADNYWLIAYLIFLVFAGCILILLPGIQLMGADTSDRSLFICSILLIACIDQLLNFMPARVRLQFDLAELLLYFTVIVSSVPLLWEVARQIVPLGISSKPGIMRAIEISLMLAMVILCVSAGFMKKVKYRQD